ncbi:MAG TPA: PTS sugar transporter subunit IIA [Acetobacteraceae bacterium]|jgi:PTS system nitrogen regulatory IIA component
MTIGDLIKPDRVIVGLRAANKLALLQELAGRAATATALEAPMVFNSLQARENLGSTGLGKGFALPHARLHALRSPCALFVRLARPIDFAAIDERPVDLAVLLLTPANGGNEHLAMMAAVSRPMRDETFIQRLRQAADAAAVHALLASVRSN